MKRAFRRLAEAVAAIFALLALGTLTPRPLWSPYEAAGVADHRILVLSNPIHTDIAIPIDAAAARLFGFLKDAGMPIDAPGARYLVFGWGGRDFYTQTPTWSDLKLAPLLKGLTLDRSVIHVDVAGDFADPNPAINAYRIGAREYDALLEFIALSFSKGPDGRHMRISNAGYGAYDGFFEAEGYFTALLGCNTWTASALRAAGLRTGWWNPLPATLAYSLRLHN